MHREYCIHFLCHFRQTGKLENSQSNDKNKSHVMWVKVAWVRKSQEYGQVHSRVSWEKRTKVYFVWSWRKYIQALPWDICHLWISMSRATLLLVPITSDSSSAAEQHHTKDRAESRAFSQGPGVTWPRWSTQLTSKWSGHLNLRSPQKSQGNLELTVPYLYNI